MKKCPLLEEEHEKEPTVNVRPSRVVRGGEDSGHSRGTSAGNNDWITRHNKQPINYTYK